VDKGNLNSKNSEVAFENPTHIMLAWKRKYLPATSATNLYVDVGCNDIKIIMYLEIKRKGC
jgi:hypothetical protein